MSSHRFADRRKCRRVLRAAGFAALLPFFGAAVLEAAPRNTRPARASAPAKASAKKSPPPPAAQSAAEEREFADILPSNTPAAPDLQLKREAERKAEALSAFAIAVVAEDSADLEKALANFRKTLEADPSYSELAVKVAYELARKGEVADGIQILKDTIKVAPKEPMPLIYLSQLYSKHLKKPDHALKYAEQALAVAPENFTSYLALYELHLGAGQEKKAEQILERAARVKTEDSKFWLQLGDLYTRIYLKENGASDPAQLEKMTAVYRKAAELGKDDAGVLSKVGDYFVLSSQVKEAIPLYQAALDAKPSPDAPVNNLRDKLARAYFINQQRDEAIAMLEEITKENPLRFETFEFLGELYEQKGEIEKAIANYEHSLLLDASQPENHLRLADKLLKARQYDKAVEVMRSAATKFPDIPQITMSLAIVLSQAKRHTEALTAFAAAHASAELSHEEMLTAEFYFSYGAAAEQAGLFERAAELLKQSIALQPANPAVIYNYLGYMWVDQGQNLDEAGEFIKKALELEPDNGAYLDSLGWYHFKMGEHEKALKALLRATENLEQEDAVVFDHIGDTYQKLGRATEAMAYWKKALALEQEDKKLIEKISAKIQSAVGNALATPGEVTPPRAAVE